MYVILIDSSTGSLVHVLMLFIQAVRGLPRLRVPGIVPCIISFSRHLVKVMGSYVFAGVGRYIGIYVCEQLPGASSSPIVTKHRQSYS